MKEILSDTSEKKAIQEELFWPRADAHLKREDIIEPQFNDPEYVWKQQYKQWNQGFWGSSDGFGYDSITGQAEGHTRFVAKFFLGSAVMSVLLFFSVWVLFDSEHPWALKGQSWVTASLHEDIQFKQLTVWYEQTFQGAPSFIPGFGDHGTQQVQKVNSGPSRELYKPATGVIISPFEPKKQGIQLKTKSASAVQAIDEGRVIYADIHEDIGFMVVIQHTNELQSIYGFLKPSNIEVNQWVKGGEQFASVIDMPSEHSRLYFAVKQDQKYINPADVIKFD
jgi:stage IV sporulation protein FA